MVAAETGTEIKPKMNFSGKVVKTSLAGALIDIGLNVQAVLHISQIPTDEKSESVRRVEDILQIGQEIEVWVKKVREGHVELTMIRPLDLEWREIKKGMNIKGKVVRIEKFGVFVEIGAERPGLVHISEMAHGYVKSPSDLVKEGDEIEAQVLDVNRKKKQIKLSMKALEPEPVIEEPKKAPESQRQYNQPQQTAGGPSKEKPQRRKKAAPPRKNREHGDSTDFLASPERQRQLRRSRTDLYGNRPARSHG